MERLFAMIGMFVMLFACMQEGIVANENMEISVSFDYNIHNELPYSFDAQSKLTREDFAGHAYLYALFGKFGSVPIHRKDENDYVVYSLANRGLCYVFLEYSPYAGISYFLKEIVAVYADSTAEERDRLQDRICSFDEPEVLMGDGD